MSLKAAKKYLKDFRCGFPAKIDPSEKEWQDAVEELATLLGWKKYHTLRSEGSDDDFPDLIALRRGRQVVAELKVGDNAPSPGQLAWLREFKTAGAEVFVWYPKDLEQVKEVLR